VAPRIPATTRWRISSFSTHNGSCVEVGGLADGRVAVRNSNDPDGPTVLFTRAELSAWIRGCQAGEFDDLA
jgi:hypothetical protein